MSDSEKKSLLSKKNEEWLKKVNELLESISPKDAEKTRELTEQFLKGEITGAELQGISAELLFEITEQAYLLFQRAKLHEAAIILTGLTLLDEKNAYYHTLLGAIFQKAGKLTEALAEYTLALEIDPNDVTSCVNRGEIYYQCGVEDAALKDFEKAIALDPSEKDLWANRARVLKKLLVKEMEEAKK